MRAENIEQRNKDEGLNMKRDIQLIWDFDDTIVKTSIEFDKTNHCAAEIVASDVFNDLAQVEEIKAYQRKLDVEMVNEIGFLPNRYLQTWYKTYEYFLYMVGKRSKKRIKEEISKTVLDVYERKYNNMPDSIPMMEALKSQGYQMIILTAGVEEVQMRKIEQSGAIPYINDVYVFSQKTPQTFKSIIDKYDFNDYVMIGNSLKSDIYPALENNAWGFHYEQATWEADDFDINENHAKYVRLSSLKEIPAKLESIQTRKSMAI